MHAFITGHLADARIADIEREVAAAGLRAQLRAAGDVTPSRRDTISGSLRRLAATLVPRLAAPAPAAAQVAPPPRTAPRSPAGFVARL